MARMLFSSLSRSHCEWCGVLCGGVELVVYLRPHWVHHSESRHQRATEQAAHHDPSIAPSALGIVVTIARRVFAGYGCWLAAYDCVLCSHIKTAAQTVPRSCGLFCAPFTHSHHIAHHQHHHHHFIIVIYTLVAFAPHFRARSLFSYVSRVHNYQRDLHTGTNSRYIRIETQTKHAVLNFRFKRYLVALCLYRVSQP